MDEQKQVQPSGTEIWAARLIVDWGHSYPTRHVRLEVATEAGIVETLETFLEDIHIHDAPTVRRLIVVGDRRFIYPIGDGRFTYVAPGWEDGVGWTN